MDKPLYSIWLIGVGWLKINDDYYACTERAIAEEIARNIGGARVYYADTNNVVMQGLEKLYLEREQRSLCHYFKKLLARKTNKFASAK